MNGIAKIGDFGLSRYVTSTNNYAGTLAGTFVYMSPEQFQGLDYSSKADLWSMGVIFYELITGKHPFPIQNLAEIVFKVLNTEPVPLADSVHPQIKQLIYGMLQKDPKNRPSIE